MKRSRFLLSLSLLPFASFASRMIEVVSKGFVTLSGESRYHGHIKLKGVNSNVLDVKVSGKDNNGSIAIFEQTSLSPGRGTPLHIHTAQDEIFHVLDGEYRFKVGEDLFTLKSGDTIFLPRLVPHAWTQMSATGKMRVIVQPAGKLEEFFVTAAALDHEPTKEEMAKIFADHEMTVVGPPLKID